MGHTATRRITGEPVHGMAASHNGIPGPGGRNMLASRAGGWPTPSNPAINKLTNWVAHSAIFLAGWGFLLGEQIIQWSTRTNSGWGFSFVERRGLENQKTHPGKTSPDGPPSSQDHVTAITDLRPHAAIVSSHALGTCPLSAISLSPLHHLHLLPAATLPPHTPREECLRTLSRTNPS